MSATPMHIRRAPRVAIAKPNVPCPLHYTPLDRRTGKCPACERKAKR